MSRRDKTGHIAYVEDVDETGNIIEGTETYAASVAPSPTKERPNTRKSRKGGSASPAHGYTDSDSTAHPRGVSRRDSTAKPRDKEKERAAAAHKKAAAVGPRPSTRHSKTTPVIESSRRVRDEAYYYGVDPGMVTTPASRPRAHTTAQRPASYYGAGSRPPVTHNKFYPPPQAMPPPSFPPPSWAAPGPFNHPAPPPPMVGHPPEYFGPRSQGSLSQRFQLNRPQSAMGYRPPAVIGYPDDYEQENERGGIVRRGSSRKTREEEDRARMPPPPPPRPMSARPLTIRPAPFAPPSHAPRSRQIVHYHDDDLDGESDLYEEVSPLSAQIYGSRPPARRPSLGTPSVSYDVGSYSTEVAATGGSRRNSYYNRRSLSSGSGLEEKLREASAYQDDIAGGSTLPLTAESLRKAGRASAAHSRSTRSSGSHEESDWRQSATTRTTRSSNEEDVTIRVKGSAVLKVGGAEMQCQDGAEINISSRDRPSFRGSSDNTSYIDIDDRRPRYDRPAIRARESSQPGSYGRTAPMAVYDPYGYPYEYGARHAPQEDWL